MMQKFNEDSNNKFNAHEKDEQKKHKRLKSKYNYLNKEWNKELKDRQEQFQMMSNRKAGEDGARKERAQEMMAKLKRS